MRKQSGPSETNKDQSLSNSEAKNLYKFKQRILRESLALQTDKIELASAVLAMYGALGITNTPRIYISNGPREASRLMKHLVGTEKFSEFEPKEAFGSFEANKSLQNKIDDTVFDYAKTEKNGLKDFLGEGRYRETLNILFRDLNFQISQSVYAVAIGSLSQLFRANNESHRDFFAHPSFADWDWTAFYLSGVEAFGYDSSIPNWYFDLLNQGLFAGYFFEGFAILVTRPSRLSKNENLVLHDEGGAAISWQDGTQFYFWNGVEIPGRLIENPDLVSGDDILKETNAEVRRCYQEVLGSERFGNLLGLETIDAKQDRFGNDLVLYRTREIDKLAGDHIYFAKVVCPSTGRNYFLCVPPTIRTAEEAVSWTFGKKPEDYKPHIET